MVINLPGNSSNVLRTEVLMKGISNPDGYVRLDFQGGWKGDKINAFTGEGLQSNQQEVLNMTKTLANFRKSSSALKTGNTTQYVPDEGLYVYFRYDSNQTVMCIMNTNEKDKPIDFSKYSERTKGFTKARSVIENQTYQTSEKITIPGNRMWVMELQK